MTATSTYLKKKKGERLFFFYLQPFPENIFFFFSMSRAIYIMYVWLSGFFELCACHGALNGKK